MGPRQRVAGSLSVIAVASAVIIAALPWAGDTLAARADRAAVPATAEPPSHTVSTKTQAIRPTTTPIAPVVGDPGRVGAVQRDPDGTLRTLTAAPGKNLGADSEVFIRQNAAALGLTPSHSTTAMDAVTTLPGGDKVQRFQQYAAGLPILGGELVFTTRGEAIRSVVNGMTKQLPVGGDRIDTATAKNIAAKAAAERFQLTAAPAHLDATLWLYDAAMVGGSGRTGLRPTYWVKIGEPDHHERASVLVDALDGSVRVAASEDQTARYRIVCDLANAIGRDLNVASQYACADWTALGAKATTRREGGPASTVAEVNLAYQHLGTAYDFFKTKFRRDSHDGRGGQIRATVRACHLSCPFYNAFWDGEQFVVGTGFTVEDVLAHEFTHGVTENASNLLYWFEAGAVNESLSDIFGQLVDLRTPADDAGTKRWLLGEDLPGGAIRDLANPNPYGQPATYKQPGFWQTTIDDNGGVHTNSGVGNRLAALIADSSVGLDRSAQLWYRTMHLLPSGSDYRTLGLTLLSVCHEFIGHYGFTPGHCDQISTFAGMVGIWTAADNHRDAEYDATICGPYATVAADQAAGPPTDVFFDDMEGELSRWHRSNTFNWTRLPSTVVPYSYAAYGLGAVNGWTAPGYNGHNSYFELAAPVQVPAVADPRMHFAFSLDKAQVADSVDILVSAAGGAWQPYAGTADTRLTGNKITGATRGYGAVALSLAAYAGQKIKIRFVINSPLNKLVDFYLDNFRIYHCEDRMGTPVDPYGFIDSSGLHLRWGPAGYVTGSASGSPQPGYQWELTFDPPIPGAPNVIAQNGELPNQLDLAGIDPNLRYRVGITARGVDGRLGATSTLLLSARAPVTCPAGAGTPLAIPTKSGWHHPYPRYQCTAG